MAETAMLTVRNPATGGVIASVPALAPYEVPELVRTAAAAMRVWAARTPRERSEVLRAAYSLMLEESDDLSRLITAESGKSTHDARAEVTYAAEFFRWNAEEAVRLDGEYGVLPGGTRKLIFRQPIGVVLCITPWNLPAAMLTRKLAPALAAGCAAVCKPAPATPLTALAVAGILTRAGVPDGLVQIMPTLDDEGVVRAALDCPEIRKLSFTGSTRTGTRLLGLAAESVVSCAMELGGNAPFIVLPDANLDVAVEAAMVAKLRHNSQACVAANRFLVTAGLAEEFTARLVERFDKLVVGDGADPATDLGPLINDAAAERVGALVDAAVAAGARVRTGGRRLSGPGAFYVPTVLDRVEVGNPILEQEIFGPVAPIQIVPDVDAEILAIANATDMGLAAFVCTADLDRALWIAEGLEAGMIGVNRGLVSDPASPFGGVKRSGLGREGGHDGVLAFTEPKLVMLNPATP